MTDKNEAIEYLARCLQFAQLIRPTNPESDARLAVAVLGFVGFGLTSEYDAEIHLLLAQTEGYRALTEWQFEQIAHLRDALIATEERYARKDEELQCQVARQRRPKTLKLSPRP